MFIEIITYIHNAKCNHMKIYIIMNLMVVKIYIDFFLSIYLVNTSFF
jgi:hypothetical protein